MKSQFLLTCSAVVLASCVGDAQFVLQQPVAARCTTAGLRDCETITQGTLLYADGKPNAGRQILLQGLRSNAGKSAELERYAHGLEVIGDVSGDGEYQTPLQPAVWLVRYAAQQEAKRGQLSAVEAPTITAQSRHTEFHKPTLIATSVVEPAQSPLSAPVTSAKAPASVFFMLAGNALAADCRFPGAPMMLCVHESVEVARIVSDIIVSPACPYDVLFASRHGIDLDWVTYAPAGKGAEVHGAALPLVPGRILTAGVSYASQDVTPDVRCGITVVWRDAEIGQLPPVPLRQTQLVLPQK